MKFSLFGPRVVLALCFVCLAGVATAADPKPASTKTAAPVQKEFATPQEAVDSLVQAAAIFDVAALTQILGPDSKDLISSDDQVADKNRAVEFAAKAKVKTSITADPTDPDLMILSVGEDDFPTPIPLIKKKDMWVFDTKVGREEILNRRIGANELDAIAICHGYFEAQHEYAGEKHDDSKLNQYAQKVLSTPGKHDGLAWKNADGTFGGPVGPEVADAIAQGYTEKSKPYHGYFFKILKGQGASAPMGKMDFVVKGAMIGGFAMAAVPAQYRVTGVKSFIIGPDGVVYEKDLGPESLKTFKSMELYNPDKTWQPTNDQW